ncbi:nuclear pore complex protein NUP1 [Prosopis cineraria]|uniref:nuclear pore complex protein NUP1 n=1 Tax=Prosopis cineraria TaxID=364024 RepID=UPI00240F1F69|nr:nuclear pore complex protein NUP1 [Prosopis cineraria]
MATAREGKPYEGGGLGAGGKFRKRPFRRNQTTPYDRPPTALRNPSTSRNYGWLSKLVDPAQRLITTGAHMLFSSVFRKRLRPPPPPTSPSPPNPLPSEAEQEIRDNQQDVTAVATNDDSVKQQGAVSESDNQINCSESGGFTELEKLLKQKTFTRSEIDHLTALLRSKTLDLPVTNEEKRTEVVTSDLILSREQKEEYPNSPAVKNGIENRLVSTPFVTSSVIDKDVASPTEVAKAYMGSRPSKVSPSKLNSQSLSLREDPTLLSSQYIPQKSPIMSIVPRATGHDRLHENGFVTPRSRGRSAIYSMAQTPYARVYPTSTPKGVQLPVEGGPSSSAQSALDHDLLSGSKKTALKRRSSVLDNDIGSLGHMRRIRQKSNLITSRGLSASVSDSPLSFIKSGVRADQQKLLLLNEAKHSDKKLSSENIKDTIPSTSVPHISSKSSDMATKILQQLDKLVSPKEKSSELKLLADKDNSPAKLSPSMLRGQALRSMETVDSSKFHDHLQDNNLNGLHENFSANTKMLTTAKEKLEHGPLKLVASVGLGPVIDADASIAREEIVSSAQSMDSSMVKSVSHPPQKSRAFRMSAHECLDLDDDVCPNGAVFSLSSEKQMIDSTIVAERVVATETITKEVPSASPVAISFRSSRVDDQTPNGTGDGSIVGEKVGLSTSTTSSSPAVTSKPDGATVAAVSESIFGSGESSSLNGSVAAPPLFNFGSKVTSSTEAAAVDTPPKESSKLGSLFSFGDKVVSPKGSVADVPLFNFGASKSFDKVQQVPLTSLSSVGAESVGMKFGPASDSKLGNSVSSTVTGATESMLKVPALDNANVNSSLNSGFLAQSSELAVSSAASTSSLTPPTSIFSFGQSLNQNNGPSASETSFSTSFPTFVSNNFTSQNMFSCSPLGANSSSGATAASSSTSMTTSGPLITFASSTTGTSSSAAATSQTPSVFKFGSSPNLTTDSPLLSSGKQDTGSGTLGSSAFGNTPAAVVGAPGNSIFGLSSSAMTTVNSQTQGSLFGSSTSLPGAHGSAAMSVFATSTQSQPIPFGSSASSPLFGLSGNTSFSSGSSISPSSSVADAFIPGSSIGLSTSASLSTANSGSSNSGATSGLFGASSWQANKSPFGSTFNSSSSGFSFGVSSGSVSSTSSSPIYGSSAASIASTASTPMFGSFTSVTSTTSMPMFGSSAASVSATTSMPMFGSSAASVSAATSMPMFGSSAASVSSTTSTPMFGSSTVASTTSTPLFGSSLGASTSSIFSFTSAAMATSTQPVFGNCNPAFSFGSAASINNDQMSMEDSMAEDPVHSSSPVTPATPAFGQQPAAPQSNFVFGAPAPSGTSPFQFGTQQNIAPQSPTPFQASSSLEVNGTGSFSLGTGGGDKSGRRFVRVNKARGRKK